MAKRLGLSMRPNITTQYAPPFDRVRGNDRQREVRRALRIDQAQTIGCQSSPFNTERWKAPRGLIGGSPEIAATFLLQGRGDQQGVPI
jgi:hypothetical protein